MSYFSAKRAADKRAIPTVTRDVEAASKNGGRRRASLLDSERGSDGPREVPRQDRRHLLAERPGHLIERGVEGREHLVDLLAGNDKGRRDHRHVDQRPHEQAPLFASLVEPRAEPAFGEEAVADLGLALDAAEKKLQRRVPPVGAGDVAAGMRRGGAELPWRMRYERDVVFPVSGRLIADLPY